MAAHASTAELQKMSLSDLLKEIVAQKELIAKLRLALTMRKEKNVAKYKTERKHLARMETVLTAKRKESTSQSAS